LLKHISALPPSWGTLYDLKASNSSASDRSSSTDIPAMSYISNANVDVIALRLNFEITASHRCGCSRWARRYACRAGK